MTIKVGEYFLVQQGKRFDVHLDTGRMSAVTEKNPVAEPIVNLVGYAYTLPHALEAIAFDVLSRRKETITFTEWISQFNAAVTSLQATVNVATSIPKSLEKSVRDLLD